jgi:hypothetical protein
MAVDLWRGHDPLGQCRPWDNVDEYAVLTIHYEAADGFKLLPDRLISAA